MIFYNINTKLINIIKKLYDKTTGAVCLKGMGIENGSEQQLE